jgi:hypothetical protein
MNVLHQIPELVAPSTAAPPSLFLKLTREAQITDGINVPRGVRDKSRLPNGGRAGCSRARCGSSGP